jgi:anaerobic ribonucleoside-triphosphate reductase activating protein
MRILYPFSTSWLDYPTNSDLAIVLYFMGCEHNCFNCHNPNFQSYFNKYDLWKDFTIEQLNESLHEKSIKEQTNKIVFSGGDPLYIRNRSEIKEFLTKNKKYDICIYTGYEITKIIEWDIKGAKYYKCGKYIDNQKDNHSGKNNDQFVLASYNQRLYDESYEEISIGNYYTFKGENFSYV